jgi:hypothetical protein
LQHVRRPTFARASAFGCDNHAILESAWEEPKQILGCLGVQNANFLLPFICAIRLSRASRCAIVLFKFAKFKLDFLQAVLNAFKRRAFVKIFHDGPTFGV